jgi:hypothetical protein
MCVRCLTSNHAQMVEWADINCTCSGGGMESTFLGEGRSGAGTDTISPRPYITL